MKKQFRIIQLSPHLKTQMDVIVQSESIRTALHGIKCVKPEFLSATREVSIFKSSGWIYLIAPHEP
jgi:hypothetical protein